MENQQSPKINRIMESWERSKINLAIYGCEWTYRGEGKWIYWHLKGESQVVSIEFIQNISLPSIILTELNTKNPLV